MKLPSLPSGPELPSLPSGPESIAGGALDPTAVPELIPQDLNDPTPITGGESQPPALEPGPELPAASELAQAKASVEQALAAEAPPNVLAPGQSIRSADGRFEFIYQVDGNLVHYRLADGKALWASDTHGRPGARCVLQDDGNLVIYDAAERPLWAANTHGNPGARLAVQDDGNVVIYHVDGRPLWSTDTWERR